MKRTIIGATHVAASAPGGRASAAAVHFILVTVFLDVLAFGLVIPVLPELVKSLSAGDPASASRWMGLLVASFAAAQLLCAPILGSLSDRFGRRPVILLSVLGAGLNHFLLAFAPNIAWLSIGRILAGVTASNLPAANAYIADVVAPESRAKSFGRIGAAFALGLIVGPTMGGLLGEVDLRLPFLAAAGLTGLNFLYGVLVLPESLTVKNRRTFSWRRANLLGSIGLLRLNSTVASLAGLSISLMLAFGSVQTVWVLFTGERFGWSSVENGLSLTAFGVASASVQGSLVSLAVGKLGERATILGSLCLMSFAYTAYGLAPNGWCFASTIVLHALAGISGPALQSIMTRSVSPDVQGGIQGALQSLNSVALIVAPLLGGALFSISSGANAAIPVAGAPFLFAALLILGGIPLARKALRQA